METRDYPDRPIVAVGAVIVHENRVVVVQRSRQPLAGRWSIPGGMVELGETLRGAAEREAQEETGLAVRAGEVLEVFENIVPDPAGKTRHHYVIVDFLCRVISGSLRTGGDAADARWASFEDLKSLGVSDSGIAVIQKVLR